ncbi:N-acetylmannosamine-6-phosphate 2-epimerase [Alteribacillus bidgolensis]|uniref:Putative N-acetylmannosamine-6-phosphate 2-epimerase n=1 Tax=Alteribacillus bidgolensis TaxID=930129 RepID=A0A1G8NKD3_9BACI|nr:N-acetylmannosamine-6-phosphate 2-epimerase [Alteribacillus bidgolensis]SDI79960.1 N-acylglucosamine-6-phosphate 2-epimerase [Alteribacillus bidgolensis]
MTHPVLQQWKNQLIVSCQALEDEPLHSSFIMGRMALAAKAGGAAGIRANSASDINEIKKQTNLPVIGIRKKVYPDSDVFITPTLEEIVEIAESGAEMIAVDATNRKRPKDEKIETQIAFIREKYSSIALMADVSSLEEAIDAEKLGFDCVSTTLIGYTKETEGQSLADNDFELLRAITDAVSIPVVAEGKISTPELAGDALENGAHCVVVGSAITRPQLITKTFYDQIVKTEAGS